MKRTVAILPVTLTNWPVLRDLAISIHNAGEFSPVVMISNVTIRERVRIEMLPLTCIDLDSGELLEVAIAGRDMQISQEISTISGITKSNWIDGWLGGWLQFFPMREIMALVKCLQLLSMAARCRAILKRFAPISLVVPGDRESGYLLPMLREARRLGIPTIVGGGILSASPNEMFPARRERPVYHATTLRSFKKKYPRQWHHDPVSCQDISVYGAYLTQAYAWLDMLPRDPWVIGGGGSDWVIVESERIRQRYIEQGVDVKKILVVGHINHDRLFSSYKDKDRIRTQLVCKYGLVPDAPILLFGPANFAEVGIFAWDYHWVVCRELAGIAARIGSNVLVTLHPRQSRSNYAFLEREFPSLKILEESLADILPAVDTYFVGAGSSTEAWALQCGIPVVVADHYPFKVRLNETMPGVVYVQEAAELADILHRIHQDREYRAKFTEGMADAAKMLGRLDGKAVERTMEIVCRPPASPMQPAI